MEIISNSPQFKLDIPAIDLEECKSIRGGEFYGYCEAEYIDPRYDTWEPQDERDEFDDSNEYNNRDNHDNPDNLDSNLLDSLPDNVKDIWNDLTHAEKVFVIKHPLVAHDFLENSHLASHTSLTEPRFSITTGWNDSQDAFRHALWSALNAYDHGIELAREYGNAHETGDSKQTEEERSMDLHNNEVGYEVGVYAREHGWSENDIIEELLKALDEGRMVTLK